VAQNYVRLYSMQCSEYYSLQNHVLKVCAICLSYGPFCIGGALQIGAVCPIQSRKSIMEACRCL